MEFAIQNFSRDEFYALRLRDLFERRGFRRVRVNKFEDYALYVENKNFLQSESVITFMDLRGKLLAFKPDVTLSVVRGIPKDELSAAEKLYYVDEVYRLSPGDREYRVRNQIGIEMIGREDGFLNIEAVDLALSGLSIIGERFVLDISHLGFVSGLLEAIDLPHTVQRQVLAAIHSKSAHDVAAALDAAGCAEDSRNRVLRLCSIAGGFQESLPKAKELIACRQMEEAHAELARLGGALRQSGQAGCLRLDFSVVNDLDYYNGLIFLGYVEGLSKAVLSGGRYDNLLKKMGKISGAVGFAVSLDELGASFDSGRQFDFDMLIIYGAECDPAALLAAAQAFWAQGVSVRLESERSDLANANFTYGKICRFANGVLQEVQG